jgi:hypothetical protein
LPSVANGWSDSHCHATCSTVVANNLIGLPSLTFANAMQTELQRLCIANDLVLHSCHVDSMCSINASVLDKQGEARDFGVSARMGPNVHMLAAYRVDEAMLCLTIHSTSSGSTTAQSAPSLHCSLTRDMVHFLEHHISGAARIVVQEMKTLPGARCQQSAELCA